MSSRLLALFVGLACALPAAAQSSTPPAAPSGGPQATGSPLDLPLTPGEREPTPPKPVDPIDPPKEEPTLYGIPLGEVDSIVYVLDVSCSMQGDRQAFVDPVTQQRREGSRLDRAKAELAKSISELPVVIEFNVVVFHTGVERWRSEPLVPAEDAAKSDAIAWIQGQRARGATATGPGVVEGLACARPEETLVVLITDGAPTAWSPRSEDHRELIRRTNGGQNRIDVIGIAASGSYRGFCMAVASDNGGRYTDVP